MRWTPEARARQAALIHAWRPWVASTGPRTELGKAIASRNADKGLGTVQIRQTRTMVGQLILAAKASLRHV